MAYGTGTCKDEHSRAIQFEVKRLTKLGYKCQTEYPIYLTTRSNRKKIVVDIRAVKVNEELLIEVGTIRNFHGNRFELLRQLRPNAKLIHITQWKNFINQYRWIRSDVL